MDNLTHSLAGIALADLALRAKPAKADRRLMVGAGIVAANLPDLDLIYTSIVPAPLGYLLHHRGHTHTVAGVVLLSVLLALAYRWIPPVRRMGMGDRLRIWLVIAAGVASHLALDALNSYGVHPYYPFDRRWYYGDAVFIFEPAIWAILGVAAVAGTRSRGRAILCAVPAIAMPVALGFLGIVPIESVLMVGAIGAAMTAISARVNARARAAVALVCTSVVIAGFLHTSVAARAAAREILAPSAGSTLADVVLTPNPAAPWCWSVIGIAVGERSGEYVLSRGTLSLAPRWRSPDACPSHRFARARTVKVLGSGRFALREETRQPLRRLRETARRDCWTAAWLRFGRAPVIQGNDIVDLRFADIDERNFSRMTLAGPRACPAFIPGWDPPRGDLLDPSADATSR